MSELLYFNHNCNTFDINQEKEEDDRVAYCGTSKEVSAITEKREEDDRVAYCVHSGKKFKILDYKIPTFIDLMHLYYDAKVNGFKGTGTRLEYHHVLLVLKNIMKWSKDDVINEFKSILELSSGRYRFTWDKAIDDFIKHYDKYLKEDRKDKVIIEHPDLCNTIWDDTASSKFIAYLMHNTKMTPTMARRTNNGIKNMIWELVRVAPHQAIVGHLGIDTKALKSITGGRMHYKDILQTLETLKLIEKTKDACKSFCKDTANEQRSKTGWKCARYKINIWLLLWITYGDRQHELPWTPNISKHNKFY